MRVRYGSCIWAFPKQKSIKSIMYISVTIAFCYRIAQNDVLLSSAHSSFQLATAKRL